VPRDRRATRRRIAIALAIAATTANTTRGDRARAEERAADAAPAGDGRLRELLEGGGPALRKALAAAEEHRLQVLYGEIVERDGRPVLQRHSFRADAEYFFPASSMKMPIALATYDRFAALRQAGKPALTRDATLRIHPSSARGEPWVTTLAHESRRALIVSDNAAANRLLALVGHREVHETLWGLGFRSARIRGGFASGESEPVTVSPAVEVVVDGVPSAALPARRSDLALPATDATSLDVGEARLEGGRRVAGPLSFADKNAMKLRELQDVLVRIMRPDLVPAPPARKGKARPPIDAPDDDMEQLRATLGTLPSESGLAGYARNRVADYPLCPFLRGIERVHPRARFRIHSKVGQAYGFVVHNAYVVDRESGRSFFLAAAVYANPGGLMNGDEYAYDTVAFPVMADIGEVLTRHAFAEGQPQSSAALGSAISFVGSIGQSPE